MYFLNQESSNKLLRRKYFIIEHQFQKFLNKFEHYCNFLKKSKRHKKFFAFIYGVDSAHISNPVVLRKRKIIFSTRNYAAELQKPFSTVSIYLE